MRWAHDLRAVGSRDPAALLFWVSGGRTNASPRNCLRAARRCHDRCHAGRACLVFSKVFEVRRCPPLGQKPLRFVYACNRRTVRIPPPPPTWCRVWIRRIEFVPLLRDWVSPSALVTALPGSRRRSARPGGGCGGFLWGSDPRISPRGGEVKGAPCRLRLALGLGRSSCSVWSRFACAGIRKRGRVRSEGRAQADR